MKTGVRNKLKHVSTGRETETQSAKVDQAIHITMPSIPVNAIKESPIGT